MKRIVKKKGGEKMRIRKKEKAGEGKLKVAETRGKVN